MSIAVRDVLYGENKSFLITASLTSILVGYSISPRTPSLTDDSEIYLTLADDIALLIALDSIR
jgi:hypothetical protein